MLESAELCVAGRVVDAAGLDEGEVGLADLGASGDLVEGEAQGLASSADFLAERFQARSSLRIAGRFSSGRARYGARRDSQALQPPQAVVGVVLGDARRPALRRDQLVVEHPGGVVDVLVNLAGNGQVEAADGFDGFEPTESVVVGCKKGVGRSGAFSGGCAGSREDTRIRMGCDENVARRLLREQPATMCNKSERIRHRKVPGMTRVPVEHHNPSIHPTYSLQR